MILFPMFYTHESVKGYKKAELFEFLGWQCFRLTILGQFSPPKNSNFFLYLVDCKIKNLKYLNLMLTQIQFLLMMWKSVI